MLEGGASIEHGHENTDELTAALISLGCKVIDGPLYDDANNPIPCDAFFETAQPADAIKRAVSMGQQVLMIGATTSGNGSFGKKTKTEKRYGVIGIRPTKLTLREGEPIPSADHQDLLKSNEIRINKENRWIETGPGITPDQLNQAILERLGPDYFVPIDLTTLVIAQMGGVAATHAQGPSRIRLAQITEAITISNGKGEVVITDPDEIEKHLGMWGTTGPVLQLRLKILKHPPHRFGFFIPLQGATQDNYHKKIAAFLEMFRNGFKLDFSDGILKSGMDKLVFDGAEEMDVNELATLTERGNGFAGSVKDKLVEAESIKGIYLTGYAEDENAINGLIEKLLALSTAEQEPATALLGGEIMHCDNASMLEMARLLREAIPDGARQASKGKFSPSTDVNTTLSTEGLPPLTPEQIQEAFRQMLEPYLVYEKAIEKLKAQHNVSGSPITIVSYAYGHLNPTGIDLHRRVTIHTNGTVDGKVVEAVQKEIIEVRSQLIKALAALPTQNPAIKVMVGEKGKLSPDAAIIAGEDGREQVARALQGSSSYFHSNVPAWAANEVRNLSTAA